MSSSSSPVSTGDELLQCPLCRGTFNEPIVLVPCGHTFCELCLGRVPRPNNRCTLCRREYWASAVNFVVKQLVERARNELSDGAGRSDDNIEIGQEMLASSLANSLAIADDGVAAPTGQAAQPGPEDVATLAQRVLYKWKGWELIRSEDSLFVGCSAILLEFIDNCPGHVFFFLHSRRGTLFSNGDVRYDHDHSSGHKLFIDKHQTAAKATLLTGTQAKCILSFPPNSSRTIQTGTGSFWMLKSEVEGTMTVTNQERAQFKLFIREDFIGSSVLGLLRHHE